jgi:hypothetical protein
MNLINGLVIYVYLCFEQEKSFNYSAYFISGSALILIISRIIYKFWSSIKKITKEMQISIKKDILNME